MLPVDTLLLVLLGLTELMASTTESLLLGNRLGDLLLGGKFGKFVLFSLFAVPTALGRPTAFSVL